MKNTILLLIFAFSIVGCSITKTTSDNQNSTSVSSEQDGSSFEKAIVIEASNESEGVSAEYAWLRKNYPDCKLNRQSLVNHNKKPYDLMEITTSEGTEKTIYFDISNFYGKF